jgi:hypothetical protein
MSAGDVCQIAQNLARSYGYNVFPCAANKKPTLKGWPDRARTDPEAVAALWRDHAGPLIGIVCGERSNLDVLDVDRKHVEALAWWQANHARLPRTRTFATRSGGLHLYYLHRHGITNTQGKLCLGVDSRGVGGYCIYWFAAGCECLDHSPIAPFPDWLFLELTYQPPAPAPSARPINPNRAIDGVLRHLGEAREGTRNGRLFWAGCTLAKHGIGQREAEALLIPIATGIGLSEYEARRTIGSAQGRNAA